MRSMRTAPRTGRAPSLRGSSRRRPRARRTFRNSRPRSDRQCQQGCRPVAAKPASVCDPQRGSARENLATPGWTSPMAIPQGGIRLAEPDARLAAPRRGSGRPSVDPNLRYGVVALHQRCAKLDRDFFLGDFETEPPAAGRRIRLGNDVLDLGLFRGDGAADVFGIGGFQLLADQIEHEYFAVVALGADRRARKPRQRRGLWRVRSPVQPVGIDVLSLRLQGRLRMPEAGDVVVNFLPGRNLDQPHLAFAPIADRLRPQARAPLKIRFQILIGGKVLLPLHQSETMRIEIGKAADLKVLWILEG